MVHDFIYRNNMDPKKSTYQKYVELIVKHLYLD